MFIYQTGFTIHYKRVIGRNSLFLIYLIYFIPILFFFSFFKKRSEKGGLTTPR